MLKSTICTIIVLLSAVLCCTAQINIKYQKTFQSSQSKYAQLKSPIRSYKVTWTKYVEHDTTFVIKHSELEGGRPMIERYYVKSSIDGVDNLEIIDEKPFYRRFAVELSDKVTVFNDDIVTIYF